MKKIKIVKVFTCFLLLSMLLLNGCSDKTITLSEGYDFTSFGSGMEIYTELVDHTMKLSVINRNSGFYQIWLVHKYNSRIKKGNEKQLVYEGSNYSYNVNIIIPQDKNKEKMEHVFIIRILNKNGDLLYKTPILNLKEQEK